MSPASPPKNHAIHPAPRQTRFHPDVVADLVKPIRTIVESLAYELDSHDLSRAEIHTRWVRSVDQALLRREPWCKVVPGTLREALISRLLRGRREA